VSIINFWSLNLLVQAVNIHPVSNTLIAQVRSANRSVLSHLESI